MKGVYKCRSRPLISSAAATRDGGSHPIFEDGVLCTRRIWYTKGADAMVEWFEVVV